MRLLVCLSSLLIASPVMAEDLNYTIYYAGSKAGTETDVSNASGEIKSDVSLKLGAVEVKVAQTAKFKGPKLTTSDSTVENPSAKTVLHYADGKLNVTTAKGTKTLPYTPKQDFYGGGLIVALWSSSAKEAFKRFDAGAADATFPVYLIDAGRESPARFVPLPTRKAQVAGKTRIARAVQMKVGSVQAEIDVDPQGTVVAFDVPSQRIRMVLNGWESLFVDPLAKYPELSAPSNEITTDLAVSMKTRDGVELVSTIVRPRTPGRYPVIMSRTPYGRAAASVEGDFYAKRGYVFVAQDVRGRGDSKGDWDPFVHEGEDGYDAIQWAASQAWSDGNVGMIGGSYGGYVQWAAAVKRPPALKCVVPQVSPPDAMHNLPYEFGVPFLYGSIWWAQVVSSRTINASALVTKLPHPEKFSTLPLSGLDKAVLGDPVPFFKNWLSRSTLSQWKGYDFYQHLQDANVPALQISGWYDGDGIGTKLIWAKEKELGRKDQWLIEGPWEHAFNTASSIGKVDFGPSAIIDLDSLYIRWFDTWLKHKSVGIEKIPHAQVFLTGANKWLNLGSWPDATENSESLWLTSSKGLVASAPKSGVARYAYDPSADSDVSMLVKPGTAAEFTGEVDLTKEKAPYLVFRSKPLAKAERIAGPAVLDLFFKSNAQDTDFFVTVVDIDERGKMYVVGQPGKLRASYLHGVEKRVPLTPGKLYEAKILPWDFAHQVKAGHSLGLVISSSGFPIFARNLGTVDPILSATRAVVQKNQLLFGAGHASSFTYHVLR